MKQAKTLYDFDYEFEELMDQAVNDLSPEQFAKFLDDISMMCGIPHAEIDRMDYDLHEIILGVIKRNPKINPHVWKLLEQEGE